MSPTSDGQDSEGETSVGFSYLDYSDLLMVKSDSGLTKPSYASIHPEDSPLGAARCGLIVANVHSFVTCCVHKFYM